MADTIIPRFQRSTRPSPVAKAFGGISSGLELAQRLQLLQEQKRQAEEQQQELALKRYQWVRQEFGRVLSAPTKELRKSEFRRLVQQAAVAGVPVNPEWESVVNDDKLAHEMRRGFAALSGFAPGSREETVLAAQTLSFTGGSPTDGIDQLRKLAEFRHKQQVTQMSQELGEAKLAAQTRPGGRPIPASSAKEISALEDISRAFGELKPLVENYRTRFGPVRGLGTRAKSLAGREIEQTLKSKLELTATRVARAIEGARMSDQDRAFYLKLLPNLDDNPNTALNKIQDGIRGGRLQVKDRVQTLGRAGFDVSGFQDVLKEKIPSPSLTREARKERETAASTTSPEVRQAAATRWFEQQDAKIQDVLRAQGVAPDSPDFLTRLDELRARKRPTTTATGQAPTPRPTPTQVPAEQAAATALGTQPEGELEVEAISEEETP